MHRLDDVCFYDVSEEENFDFYLDEENLEKTFYKVFENLNDVNGSPITNKIVFKKSYIQVVEKCTIENSMDLIYSLLNKHLDYQETTYFRDDSESLPSSDVLKVIELIRHLHGMKIPKRFIGGFLLLMVKFIYFPIQQA